MYDLSRMSSRRPFQTGGKLNAWEKWRRSSILNEPGGDSKLGVASLQFGMVSPIPSEEQLNLFQSNTAGANPVPTTEISIDVHCTSTGKLCNPPFETTVKTSSLLKIEYVVTGHCSLIRLHIFVETIELTTTAFFGWAGEPLPLSTGILNLGPVALGQHVLGLEVEGKVGGYNTGQFEAWDGIVRIYT